MRNLRDLNELEVVWQRTYKLRNNLSLSLKNLFCYFKVGHVAKNKAIKQVGKNKVVGNKFCFILEITSLLLRSLTKLGKTMLLIFCTHPNKFAENKPINALSPWRWQKQPLILACLQLRIMSTMPNFLLQDVLALLRLYFAPQQFENLANIPEPTPRSFVEQHCNIWIIVLHTGKNVPY